MSWCFCKSPCVNLVRTRSLEPATVVSASADEHEYECHLSAIQASFARGSNYLIAPFIAKIRIAKGIFADRSGGEQASDQPL